MGLNKYGESAIRFSLYDWQDGEGKYFLDPLAKIRQLRKLIDQTGSKLEIGASILTRTDTIHRYEAVARMALESGIHWLYFHPYCIVWDTSYPKQADQTGVIAALNKLKESALKDSNIQIPYERYTTEPLIFDKLHGSHFLIQVGADGINYAGPECKYHRDYELLDLNKYMKDDFLWHPQRVQRINELNSDNYQFKGTKHRPPMFSHYIQKLINKKGGLTVAEENNVPMFSYPNII